MIHIEAEIIVSASTGAINFLKEWFDDARFNHQEAILHMMICIKLMDATILRHNKSACGDGEVLASMNKTSEEASLAIFDQLKPYIDTLFEKKYKSKE